MAKQAAGLALVEGTGANKTLLVFENREEQNSYMVKRLMRRAGWEREAFLLSSLENPSLNELIKNQGVQVVVGMGEKVLHHLLGEVDVMRWRGRFTKHPMGIWQMVTFEPSQLVARRAEPDEEAKVPMRHPPRFQGLWMLDVARALQVVKQGYKRVQPSYLCDPSPENFAKWAAYYEATLAGDPDTHLSWDIETPYKQKNKDESELEEAEFDPNAPIIRVSFAYAEYSGVSVPWTGPYMPTIKRLLASKGPMVVWNGNTFDVPLVKAQGIEVGGTIYDYMDGFHVLQSDLPKGLEFVSSIFTDLLPWKHLNNSDAVLYSAIDADAALRNALGIRAQLKKQGMWDAFLKHSVKLMPKLYEAGQRGNQVNIEKREKFRAEWTAKRDALIDECQQYIPMELLPVKRFKRIPKNPKPGILVENIGKVNTCTKCGASGVTKGKHLKGGKKNPCHGAMFEKRPGMVTGWHEYLKWNPNSSEQLKKYMRHFGHPVGKHAKDQDKETADSKHLKKLVKEFGESHPVYAITLEIHKISKAVSTYLFKTDAENRVHTTYVNSPSTWRLGSRDVNMQNLGKREENKYALQAREIIVASPGHVLIQADSSSIEAVMVGYFMGDPTYIELARRGVHDFMTCYELGIPFTDAAIAEYKEKNPKYYKEVREKCKRVVHGTNYGMGPWLMTELYPETFPRLRDAQRMQNKLFTAIPNLKKWQHETMVRAQKETFIQSPWGHRHYFYDVFTQTPEGKIKKGKDAKRAIAFPPQNGAGCFMRDNLLIIAESEFGQYMPANVSVHDGYVLDVPDRDGIPERAIDFLVEVLTRPIPEMGGLQIGCAVERGYDWKNMDEIKKVSIN